MDFELKFLPEDALDFNIFWILKKNPIPMIWFLNKTVFVFLLIRFLLNFSREPSLIMLNRLKCRDFNLITQMSHIRVIAENLFASL